MTKVNKSTYNQISHDARARYGAVAENQNLFLSGIQNDGLQINKNNPQGNKPKHSRYGPRYESPTPLVIDYESPAKLPLDL